MIAVKLMYAGAVLTAVDVIINVIAVLVGGVAALRTSYPHETAAQLDATQHRLLAIVVFSGLIEVALWVLMARMNKVGLKWARTVATVLFALNTWSLVEYLHGAVTVAILAYTALLWLVGLGVIFLLWQQDSTAYFGGRRRTGG